MASRGEEIGNERPQNHQRVEDLISSLPRNDCWVPLCLNGGFWLCDWWMSGWLAAQKRMVARDDDILIASIPKSGTTWLKALVFATVHRGHHLPGDPMHPLRCANPHEYIRLIEGVFTQNKEADLVALPSPRIMSTHTPYSLLPESVRDSGCRVVYICRDPKDIFVSRWHFTQKVCIQNRKVQNPPLEQAFEMFCLGIFPSGPYWENILEFWNESLRRPDKVFFLRYEDMKEDGASNLRKLAEFLGKPFRTEEEQDGTVGDILELCSFSSLKGLEVNKSGSIGTIETAYVPRSSLFRLGEVGDWVNHLTPEMAKRLDKITQEKLQGSGLNLHSGNSL